MPNKLKSCKINLALLIAVVFFIAQEAKASGTANLRIEILSYCGNNIKEGSEYCDGTDMSGASCSSRGFNSGTLTCNSNCTAYVTSQCTSVQTSGGNTGSGGGGGGGGYLAPVTSVIFSGRAYPMSKVGILKDGQLAATTIAGPDAKFNVTLTGLGAGNFTFSIYGEDGQGRRSTLFTFPIFLTTGATTQVSGIFIAPTIAVDKTEVKRGENIAIFGKSLPNSEVTISVNSAQEMFSQVQADSNGAYLVNFDTSPLEEGQHFTKSKAARNGEISSFSQSVGFNVGSRTAPITPTVKFLKGDFNRDGRVNLIDFSIAAYWYKRTSPPVIVDLNDDRKVNLIDFSILAYYWTG